MIATAPYRRRRFMAKKAARTASTPGRKPLPDEERRKNTVHVRFRDDELDAIKDAVADEGERAAFIREAALKEAERIRKRRSGGG